MPQFSPNSPWLNPVPQPREALLSHDLGRDFPPSPLTWKRSRAPLPEDCQQWGKHKQTHTGMGKAGEIPHGSTALTHPQITPGKKKNLRLSAPLTHCSSTPWRKAKQRLRGASLGPGHLSTCPLHHKGINPSPEGVEKELSSPKCTVPW